MATIHRAVPKGFSSLNTLTIFPDPYESHQRPYSTDPTISLFYRTRALFQSLTHTLYRSAKKPQNGPQAQNLKIRE